MTPTTIRSSILCLAPLLLVAAAMSQPSTGERLQTSPRSTTQTPTETQPEAEVNAVRVQYLEIVTPAVAETCKALAASQDVVFSEPIAMLGNARTATLKDGGRIGVRAPMRPTEKPVVRPYLLVDDIEAAVEAAKAAGGEVALPPTEIPGQGTFSIYILGGIEHGLWKN